MTEKELSSELLSTLQDYYSLGINDQIKYDKFYLYSIITHSTAIEGSTVTEVEAQLLFDKGITSSKRTIKSLKEKNLLERINSKKTGSWKVKH